MESYKPIRITKTIQISVKSREDAKKRYPHGELQTMPVVNAAHLPGFTVIYKFPQRINVPTEAEESLVKTGVAQFIPQNKKLGVDDVRSDLRGSVGKTKQHKRTAAKEINKRLDEVEEEAAKEKKDKKEKKGKTEKTHTLDKKEENKGGR